jgi:N-acetyl sugar amidotransferase
MDTSDPDIRFDPDGVCQYCTTWLKRFREETVAGNPAMSIETLADRIRADGRGKEYDCIIGVSGGCDSTYVALVVKELGLRPLAVHFDNGWNAELAVDNIHRVLKNLDIDLFTYVVDWEEFRDLQLSFLRASVTNIEIPTDHGINALLQHTAAKHRVPFILSGSNIRGEGIYPRAWGWYNLDLRHLRAVHRRFGSRALSSFPQISLAAFACNAFARGVRTISILNYLDYNRLRIAERLTQQLGWRPYGGKHYESVFTRFFQGYILPRKFKIDKRRGHLSSLIVAGDLNRHEALAELERDPYAGADLAADLEFFLKKLGLSREEFDRLMNEPPRDHTEYPTNAWFFDRAPALRAFLKRRVQHR